MDRELDELMQESEFEWSEIQKQIAIREMKDRRIISKFCANNKHGDIIRSIELLEKNEGLPGHDKEVLGNFKQEYPDNLKVRTLHDFLDIQDIYSSYLESGGNEND